MLNGKTNNSKGNLGIGKAISYFTENEFVVSIPLNDTQKYDLVVDINGILSRVQVKTTTTLQSKSYRVDLRTSGGNRSRYKYENFDKTKIDILFVFTDGGSWLIPSSVIQSARSVTLGDKYMIYKI